MEYSIQCPAPCNYEIKVEATGEEEAVEKIMKAGAAHKNECPVAKNMNLSEEQMRSMVRSMLKKNACGCMAK